MAVNALGVDASVSALATVRDIRTARAKPKPTAPKLPHVSANGFTVWATAYAFEGYDYDQPYLSPSLHFLSLIGPLQSLRAIWAYALGGGRLQVWGVGHDFTASLIEPKGKKWRSFPRALPNASGHQLVLLHESAKYDSDESPFLLLPRTPAEAPDLYYKFLDRRVDTPLHPDWKGWLWDLARAEQTAKPLASFGIEAYRCTYNPLRLMDSISAAIQAGTLAIS